MAESSYLPFAGKTPNKKGALKGAFFIAHTSPLIRQLLNLGFPER